MINCTQYNKTVMKGYKKARAPNGREVMVTLLIPPHARTNIYRKNVRDRELAKHRCEFCLVTEIKDIETGVMYDTAISISNPSKAMPLIYNKGEYVRCFGYEPKERVVCGGGIHFYISHTRALYHKDPFRNNKFTVWYEDGGLRYYGETIQGNIFNGCLVEYNRDGQVLKSLDVVNNIVQKYTQYYWETKIFYKHKGVPDPIVKRLTYSKEIHEYKGANIYEIIPMLKEYR